MGLENFIERPLAVAAKLNAGECGGTYVEACLLISGVMSGIASLVWPGTGIDRARFVEAWIRLGTPSLPAAGRISIPLLIDTLWTRHRQEESKPKPKPDQPDQHANQVHKLTAEGLQRSRPQMFGDAHSDRVLTGDDVDADEAETVKILEKIATSIDKGMLRRHSYAAIFYEHVRSQLVHEYELGSSATSYPMISKPDPGVSYSNTARFTNINGKTADDSTREIHFHIPWLIELTRGMAREAARIAPEGKLAHPEKWWIQQT